MICSKCENEISDNSMYCNKCGQKIKTISPLRTRKPKIITGIIVILILISIGGYNYYSSLPPKNVKEVVYKATLLYIDNFEKHKKDNWSVPTDEENKNMLEFCDLIKNNASSTPEELAIRKGLLELSISYISDAHNKLIGESYGADYNKRLKELKDLLNKK
ncbi:zinc-ribbon domain-containing protein [Clostridium sp. DJ247]|uniref:zinc-ribbon domain-containing protein n=1 Tax=Clostridium sp. DJ247 TaxID=2726188 RepID=UPI001623617E|nr:zinc-ribbon domain-containing protein [Clostridium sp. DJ247]MBC2580836.1 zinc ribbon domain-containing protein [Clostridium sp. DJ247]